MGQPYGHRSRGGPPKPPDPLQEVRKTALKMYDHHNGEGADWAAMAETLFRLAFEAVGHLAPDNAGRRNVLRRAETAVYERLHGPASDTP